MSQQNPRTFDPITDTAVHTAGDGGHADVKYWTSLFFLADTVFHANDDTVLRSGKKPILTTIHDAGTTLHGYFTVIHLASGEVYAYKQPEEASS